MEFTMSAQATDTAILLASPQAPTLVPVKDLQVILLHAIARINGAIPYPFVADIVYTKLRQANELLQQIHPDMELVVLDAYRTPVGQKSLLKYYYNNFVKLKPQLTLPAFKNIAGDFLAYTKHYNAYSAGGAVDVSLLRSGRLVAMPSKYADLYSYTEHRVTDKSNADESRILTKVMESVGFVSDQANWWHYQYGTKYWAIVKNEKPLLTQNFPLPFIQDDGTYHSITPRVQPGWQAGVAQIFTQASSRLQSITGMIKGHDYVRTRHPTLEGLGDLLKREFNANKIYLLESGLSACLVSLKALLPPGGTLLYDKFIHYETRRSIVNLAKLYKWHLISEDLIDANIIGITGKNTNIDAVFVDNPRNWFLDTLDIAATAKICKQIKAKLLVDISLQPLQDALGKGADVAVVSLSKYPANGMTIGGAIICHDSQLGQAIENTCIDEGHVLSPCAATTIWEQATSLSDRLHNVSHKAEVVAKLLSMESSVKKVRLPNKALLNGYCGGQLSFHIHNIAQGNIMEAIIGHNSLSMSQCLHLACTFGASFTTFEYFGADRQNSSGLSAQTSNERLMPNDMIRLSIGCEPVDKLVKQLTILLRTSEQVAKC
jgi:D-alanyl-D-alanine dipeptidase